MEREEKPSQNDPSYPTFGGHQTLEERERSFHASSQTIHCGFVKGQEGFPSTGFDLDAKDKTFMSTCSVVVSSCIFGSSDFLRRPASKLVNNYILSSSCSNIFREVFELVIVDQCLYKLYYFRNEYQIIRKFKRHTLLQVEDNTPSNLILLYKH